MLRWFRIHAPRVAFTVLVSLAAVGASAVSPHEDDCHDAACRAMAVEHDGSAHRIDAPSTDGDIQPLHCLVCHWVRSFRPRAEARFLPTPAIEAGTAVHVELFTAARSTQVAQPSLRSPPQYPIHA